MIRFWSVIQSDAGLRKWFLQVLSLLLAFILLALLIWLYYDYQIRRIERLDPSVTSRINS